MSKAKDLLVQMASVLKVDCDVSLKKQFNDAIAELEAQEAKSCEGCVSYDEDKYMGDCEECSLRYKSMFKLKES